MFLRIAATTSPAPLRERSHHRLHIRAFTLAATVWLTPQVVNAFDWADPPETLPGTAPLTWDGPLDVRMMDGAHRHVERRIENSPAGRAARWRRDLSSRSDYEASIAANRERFRQIIGAVDRGAQQDHNIGLPPTPIQPRMIRYGDDQLPALLEETESYRMWRVRWPVLRRVWGEGVLLEPRRRAAADVVLLPDAGRSPEHLAGLLDKNTAQRRPAIRLAEHGVRVLSMSLIDRAPLLSGPQRQTRREWIYRQAFHMGRHVIGYEVEKVQAAIDWLQRSSGGNRPVGVAGYGEGGLLAFYAAAVDPRVDATLVSGYFGPREQVWREPIYRNVWSLLSEFGDAEIATLIAPRPLVIEHSPQPTVVDEKGELRTPTLAEVRREVARIDELTRPRFQQHDLVAGNEDENDGLVQSWSGASLSCFVAHLGVDDQVDDQVGAQPDAAASSSPEQSTTDAKLLAATQSRQRRQTAELDDYTQRLVRDSDHVRDDFFLYKVLPELKSPRWSTALRHETTPVERFTSRLPEYRRHLWEEVLGKFDEPLLPANPRSRRFAKRPGWTAYDVVLDVLPDLFAWGILIVPTDLQPGERRPVVVVQHGRNGLPQNIVGGGYNGIAGKLLRRGFIVFAPHNLYRNEQRYRWLDRKANSVKASLFSFLLAQHDQITRWLESLDFVDGDRIAFYGNSYGGESAVRIPPLLPRYALSICASDFNDWTRKVADTHHARSFMNTDEWEMPYFNMGSTFSYAELAYLMVPRPFMAERGHHDLVAPDSWVAYEFAKVRWLYDQLGLPERRAIDFFQGGHTMNGEATVEFLERHLQWPAN